MYSILLLVVVSYIKVHNTIVQAMGCKAVSFGLARKARQDRDYCCYCISACVKKETTGT